jgi:hypothetical protein
MTEKATEIIRPVVMSWLEKLVLFTEVFYVAVCGTEGTE